MPSPSVVLLENCRDGGEDEEEGGHERGDGDEDGEDAEDAEVLQKEHRAAAAEHQDVARDADEEQKSNGDPEEDVEGRVRVGGVPVLVSDEERERHGPRRDDGEPELLDDLVDVVHEFRFHRPVALRLRPWGKGRARLRWLFHWSHGQAPGKRTSRGRAEARAAGWLFRETGVLRRRLAVSRWRAACDRGDRRSSVRLCGPHYTRPRHAQASAKSARPS